MNRKGIIVERDRLEFDVSYRNVKLKDDNFFISATFDLKLNELNDSLDIIIMPILCFFISAILLLKQPDFGSTAVIFLMTLVMLFIARAKIFHLMTLFFSGAIGASILIYLSPERLSRFNLIEAVDVEMKHRSHRLQRSDSR